MASRVLRDYLGLVRNELHVFEAVYAPRFNPGIEARWAVTIDALEFKNLIKFSFIHIFIHQKFW